ncbi:MAG: response regulator transcription factor [Nitrospinota bacterium]
MARVLIVDDEPDFCMVLKAFLVKRGHEVLLAFSGEDALVLLQGQRPHLMLLDIRMPGMSGIEVLKRVREDDKEMGIIMVSAIHEEEMIKKVLALGANDYITKPVDLHHLEKNVLPKLITSCG